MDIPRYRCGGINRRAFLAGAGAGLVAGGGLGYLGFKSWNEFETALKRGQRTPLASRANERMPGPYPGRVVEVRHDGSVDDQHRINRDAVKQMIDRGMCELTGMKDDPAEAWRKFFVSDDVVGIKVNPVGRAPKPGEPGRMPGAVGSISNPEVVLEIVKNLREHARVPARNIILFERYADEFIETGYDKLVREREMDGVRWYCSSFRYDEQQTDIHGQMPGNRHPNVVGYDPDVFVKMGFAAPDHDPKDDRRERSHLSLIVTKMVSKIITIPVLKDHRSAGVTLALKNMSHGCNNNVARSHIGAAYRRDGVRYGPNQCNTFIPTAVNQAPMREKATLHILDGLIAVYEGGPGCWNRSWGTWDHKGLFFATDPVAMDHIGWEIIDAKRAERGWAPVGEMGLLRGAPMAQMSPQMAAMMVGGTPPGAGALLSEHYRRVRLSTGAEPFNLRQPDHIILGGMVGLGTWDPAGITHNVVRLPSA